MYKYHFFEYFQPVLSHAESCIAHPNKAQLCGRLWRWLDAAFVAVVIAVSASVVLFISRQKKLYTKYLEESERRDRLKNRGFVDEDDSINGMPLDEAKAVIRDVLESKKD